LYEVYLVINLLRRIIVKLRERVGEVIIKVDVI